MHLAEALCSPDNAYEMLILDSSRVFWCLKYTKKTHMVPIGEKEAVLGDSSNRDMEGISGERPNVDHKMKGRFLQFSIIRLPKDTQIMLPMAKTLNLNNPGPVASS